MLQTIAGYDKLDDSTVDLPVPNFTRILSGEKPSEDKESNKFKVGIPVEFFFDVIDSKVMRVFEKFVDRLKVVRYQLSPLPRGTNRQDI